ncbi:MAG: DUF2782 domain-containing protein [Chromatiaceae bacterium]|nr:DUF2782 domain-containing protein [Chromatiaceae bacterium]
MVKGYALTMGLLLAASASLMAQDEEAGGGYLEAPTLAPAPVVGETVEPEITIREEGDRVIYEYRVRGVLYMARVQPQVGPPYYLLDTDGDGVLDVSDASPRNLAVPQWLLFSWD